MLAYVCLCAVQPDHTLAASGADYYNQGLAAANGGDYASATHDFEQALLHGHNDPGTFYQLGIAYQHVKRYNDAAWAIVTALSDPVFNATSPTAQKALDAAQNAGGADLGPPSLLRTVTVQPMKAPPLSPARHASQESAAAFSALLTGAFFVAPEYNHTVTATTSATLSATAEDIQNRSNTVVKFAFLGAIPSPYTELSAYARDFLTHLNIQQAVFVVVTPQSVAAATDRLDESATRTIVASQQKALGTSNVVALAAAVAHAVVQQADDNDSAATHRAIAIGLAVGLAVLAALAYSIVRVARRDSTSIRPVKGRARVAPGPRTR